MKEEADNQSEEDQYPSEVTLDEIRDQILRCPVLDPSGKLAIVTYLNFAEKRFLAQKNDPKAPQ